VTRLLRTSISLALLSVAIPLRAGNRPHGGTDSQTPAVWTNDDPRKTPRRSRADFHRGSN